MLRWLTCVATVLAVLSGDAALIPAAQAAAPQKPAAVATDLPLLRSDPPPVAEPQVPTGNFSGMPGPSGLAPIGPAPAKPSFDLATSVPLDDQTTPTKRVFRNDDGTFTNQLSLRPVRHRGANGNWVDDDLKLVASPDGTLAAAAAGASSAVLSDSADGNVATVATSAGPVVMRHPQASSVPAALGSATATFADALPGAVDLAVAVTADGFEETVILPDRTTGRSYTEELVLPAGVSARDTAEGLELVDPSGAVVAGYGRGIAHDTTFPAAGVAATTPVSVRVTASHAEGTTTVVSVEVAVSEGWWAGPLAFPVTIDPVFFTQTATTGGGWDTMVSAANPTTSYWNYQYLDAGGNATELYRSYLRFDLSSIPAGPTTYVSDSTLWLGDWYSPDCINHQIDAYRLTGAISATASWNNRPPVAAAPQGSGSFAKGGPTCAADWVTMSVTDLATDWVRNGVTNYGMELRAANEADPASVRGFYSVDYAGSCCAPSLYVTWNRQPPPAYPATPADGAVVTTDSPTLAATPVTDPDGDTVVYYFRATTTPDAEWGYQPVNSGWLTTPSYTVPPGILKDGETYWWHVYTWAGEPGTSPHPDPHNSPATAPVGTPFSLRVDLRLGASGSQPYDAMGPVKVNLSSGNVAASFAGPAMGTVGGPVGVGLSYNSASPATPGLVGSYYNAPAGPTSVFPTTAPAMVRTDPHLALAWIDSPGAPIGVDNYLVRWAGKLTAPAAAGNGTYTFSVAHFDGVRIWVGGALVMDRWTATGTTGAALSSSFGLSALVPVDIVVEARNDDGAGGVLLGVYGPGAAANGLIVPPSWLSPTDPPALSPGWSLSPAPYTGARVAEGSAILTDGSGSAETWRWGGTGFTPPAGRSGTLAKDANGLLTLHDAATTYTFDPAGRLASSSVPVDDGSPASAKYEWTGTPKRLTKITDPVSGRFITLYYAANATDAACPRKDGIWAPVGRLCTLSYWDGTQTIAYYNPGAQVARIESPGGAVTDLAYGTDGLLSKIRDPLAADVVANVALGVADDDGARTVVTYSAGKVSRVVGPRSASGLSPGRDYIYNMVSVPNAAEVHVDGLATPTTGYARRVTFDSAGRTLSDSDATARLTTTEWIGTRGDVAAAVTDPAGRKTTSLYDSAFNPTDTYGPAPSSCFGTDRKPNNTCSPMPHSSTVYDDAMQGLAATYWANANLAGDPGWHDSVGGGSGDFSVDWAARPPGTALGTATWSARLTGDLVFGAGGTVELSLGGSGTRTLWVDDRLVPDGGPVTGTAGSHHRMVIDYVASPTPALSLLWRGAGGTYATLPASSMTPSYGLVSRQTTDDSTTGSPPVVSAVSYAFPHTGQPTAVIVDPAGAALTTNTTYEDPLPGRFGRRTSKSLPAGNITGFGYYGNSESRTNPCGTASASQAGLPKLTTNPDPDGAGPATSRLTEVVHDSAGRPVASRVNTEPWSCVAYDTRGRVSSRTVPTFGGSPARTVTYIYAVGGDPRVNSVTDSAGTITSTIDLVGQVGSYTDATANTTTSTYDQPGRLTHTAGPGLGWSTDTDYDPASRPTVQKVDGNTLATATYNSAGELERASHLLTTGNGTELFPIGRDNAGRTTALTWKGPGQTAIASDAVVRSQSGRVMSETIDGVAAATFSYDAPGRLSAATVPGHTLSYGFATSTGCAAGSLATAGKNTNRISSVDNATTIMNCYDSADRLMSSSDPSVGAPVYDAHGNTTTLGNQTLAYDGADRHVSTVTAGTTTVTYKRDATDRIIERQVNGSAVARYGYAGPGDSPAYTSYGLLLLAQERSFGLIGGAVLSKGGPNGDTWSYPNVHGDVVAVANALGVKTASNAAYDPFGKSLSTLLDNEPGNFDNGWLGSHQRPTEHEAGTAMIEMGARPYLPSLGRFLEVDPLEGGSCNIYEYACGDPANGLDLSGMGEPDLPPELAKDCEPGRGADFAAYTSNVCIAYRTAQFSGKHKRDFYRQGFNSLTHPVDVRFNGGCPAWVKSFAQFAGFGDYGRAAQQVWRHRFSKAVYTFAKTTTINDLENQALRAYSLPVGAVITAVDAGCSVS